MSGDDAQHRFDVTDALERVDLGDRAAHGELVRLVRDEHERDAPVLPRGTLHHLHDGDVVLAENRGESSARILPVDFDRSPKSDLGYSGWVQFADGEIYIVNYIVDDAWDKAQIRGYSLRMNDFFCDSERKEADQCVS